MDRPPSSQSAQEEKLARLRAAVKKLEAEVQTEASASKPVAKPTQTAAAIPATNKTRTAPNNPAIKTSPAKTPTQSAIDIKPRSNGSKAGPSRANHASKPKAAPITNAQTKKHVLPQSDESKKQESLKTLAGFIHSSPAWLTSFVLHTILFIILGIMTIPLLSDKRMVVVSTVPDAAIEEIKSDIEIDADLAASLEQANAVAIDTIVPDPGEMKMGDFATNIDLMSELGTLASADKVGDPLGAGDAMAKIGEGMSGAASFFGAKSKGKNFVFVVDNSNSMGRGRLETALFELMKSVEQMDNKQRFYVIFFSDTAYGLFHPRRTYGMIPATYENKRKLREWLPTVQRCLKTKGQEAVEKALKLNPDVIYILGDGAFTDNTTQILTRTHSRKTVINTVGMQVDPRGAKQLAAIAKANRGTFRKVTTSPQSVLISRQNPIKANNTRGPVWGLKLPAKPKKKK